MWPKGKHDRCLVHERKYERQRGTAASRGYDAEWRRRRAEQLAAHPFCADPFGHHAERGEKVRATTVDHVLAKRKGGTDAPTNLHSHCTSCHSEKTAREDGRWG